MKTIEYPDKDPIERPKAPQKLPAEPKRVLEKTGIISRKLTEYELRLYEYSSFSLTEEIDIFYCKKVNIDFDSKVWTENTLKCKV